MIKLTIPRKEWTGTTESRSRQRGSFMTPNYSGEMCCLGHLFCQLFPIEMANYVVKMKQDDYVFTAITMPVSAFKPLNLKIEQIPEWMLTGFDIGKVQNSEVADQLARLNDNDGMDQSAKEAGIAYVFEQYGYDLEFV